MTDEPDEWDPASRVTIDAHSIELIDPGEGDGATLQVRGDSWEVDINVSNGDVLQLVTDGAEYVASVSARMIHESDD